MCDLREWPCWEAEPLLSFKAKFRRKGLRQSAGGQESCAAAQGLHRAAQHPQLLPKSVPKDCPAVQWGVYATAECSAAPLQCAPCCITASVWPQLPHSCAPTQPSPSSDQTCRANMCTFLSMQSPLCTPGAAAAFLLGAALGLLFVLPPPLQGADLGA